MLSLKRRTRRRWIPSSAGLIVLRWKIACSGPTPPSRPSVLAVPRWWVPFPVPVPPVVRTSATVVALTVALTVAPTVVLIAALIVAQVVLPRVRKPAASTPKPCASRVPVVPARPVVPVAVANAATTVRRARLRKS